MKRYGREIIRGMGATLSVSSVQQLLINAANQNGIPPSIALGVAAHESGFQANKSLNILPPAKDNRDSGVPFRGAVR